MNRSKLALKDKPLFHSFLGLSGRRLSAYSFTNIFIWRRLYDINWVLIDDNLCLFFADKTGVFMYLPPLGKEVSSGTVREAFGIMDKLNRNKAVSRIENIEANDIDFYRGLGLRCYEKPGDYLYLRRALAELKGDHFKSKRSGANQFMKQYRSEYLDYSPDRKDECLGLYAGWMSQRRKTCGDRVYQGMLADNLTCLEELLSGYEELGPRGRMVLIDGKVRGVTFGLELNNDTFCVIFEVTDLGIRGLSQYIFRRFCAEMSRYKYINIMDDCGLEGLRRVKLSYRPKEIIPNYIASGKNE